MEPLARFVVRFPILIVLIWIAAIGAIVATAPKGAAPHTPPPRPFAAQQAQAILDHDFPGNADTGNHPPVNILMVARDRVTAADLRILRFLRGPLLAWTTSAMGWTGPDQPVVKRINGPVLSKDGKAALTTLTYTFTGYCYPDCNDVIEHALQTIRPRLRGGVGVVLTDLGLIYQAQDKAFSGLTDSGFSPTLIACIVLLLVILGAVYRAPLAVVVPLICIGAVVFTSLTLVKMLAIRTSWVPHGDITNEFVSVVLFGAGTNYCLFLLSRYREALRDNLAPRNAIILALTRVGEAISSSAGTVIAAMAVLGFTLSPMFRAIGPSVAVAIALMLAAGLTLVPALMRLCGAALFWPTRPRWTAAMQRDGVPRGVWHAVGRIIARRPLATMLACLVVLLPLAAFAAALSPSYDDLRTLPASNPAVRAALAVQTHFGSITESDTLVIAAPSMNLNSAAGSVVVRRLSDAARADPAVRQVGAATIAPSGHAAAVPLTLAVETSSPEAHRVVARLQSVMAAAALALHRPGIMALLSGDSPRTHDEAVQVAGDFRFILVWTTLIIFIILVLMVRSFSAPLYLLATVALSAGSAVGLTVLVFHEVLGQEIYYSTPVFAFVFLVALGEDFNILLMSRIREEVTRLGLRAGVARAVGRTGATLSNCGLIMAGTFGVLMQFDVTFLRQIGFAVAAGVLLDTFIIRPLLVPSIVVLLGRWNWVTVRGVRPLPEPRTAEGTVAIA